jgi:hypothetical protein
MKTSSPKNETEQDRKAATSSGSAATGVRPKAGNAGGKDALSHTRGAGKPGAGGGKKQKHTG